MATSAMSAVQQFYRNSRSVANYPVIRRNGMKHLAINLKTSELKFKNYLQSKNYVI